MGVGVGVIWSVVSGGGWICAVVGGGVRGVGVGVGWCRGCSLPGGSFGCVPRVFFLFRAGMPICSRDLAYVFPYDFLHRGDGVHHLRPFYNVFSFFKILNYSMRHTV